MWKREKIGSTSRIVFDHVTPVLRISKESLESFLERDDAKGGLNIHLNETDENEHLVFSLKKIQDSSRYLRIVKSDRILDHIPSQEMKIMSQNLFKNLRENAKNLLLQTSPISFDFMTGTILV